MRQTEASLIAGGSSDTESFMEELKDLAKGQTIGISVTGFVQGAMLDELYSNAYIIHAAVGSGRNAAESSGGNELRQLLPGFGYSGVRSRWWKIRP